MTVVHRPFLPSVQCGSAPPRREKTTRRSCPSNNSSSSPGFFLSPPSLGRAPSALFLGTHPSWNVGVEEEEEEGRRRSSGEKKRGLFLMSQLLRGCRKWGEGLFWAALFSEATKASVPGFFLFHPKRGGERGKDVAMERCHFRPRKRERKRKWRTSLFAHSSFVAACSLCV